jgi:2-polyprenyl-6-methoxyphenol hydroxylase-like FAD-dependent oxidoreductase
MTRTAIVVGAGIGGLSTATGLQRAGWSVTVLERWPEVVGVGAGIGVWPDAQRALDRLGVGAAFQERAVAFGPGTLRRADGRRLARLPDEAVARRAGIGVRILSRADLVDVLHTAATGAGATVRTGVEVRDVGALLAAAEVVVAADGLHSQVRQEWFGASSAPRDTGRIAWRGAADVVPDSYGETWGGGALFGVTRLGPGRTNWYAVPPRGTPAATLDDVRAVFAAWHEPVPYVLAATRPEDARAHRLAVLDPPLATFVRGRVALLGDAAHAMLPTLGRGACEAILDADALVDALRGQASVEDALARYDARRRRPAQRTVRRSALAARVALATRLVPVRDTAVRLAGGLVG